MKAGNELKGLTAYHAGLVAEDQVANRYRRRGCELVERRWRGSSGEIDLIFRDSRRLIFVEVKKSRTFNQAFQALGAGQAARIQSTVQEYLARVPNGELTEMRIDVAALDANGQMEILENAIGQF